MVAGVPWTQSTDNIIKAIKKAKGRVSHASKALGVDPVTFYKRMNKEPAIKESLDQARDHFNLSLLDEAENTLMYAIGKHETDINNALKSSFFVLNNKGKDRGYSPRNNPNNQSEVSADDIASFIRQTVANNKDVPRASDAGGSEVEIK